MFHTSKFDLDLLALVLSVCYYIRIFATCQVFFSIKVNKIKVFRLFFTILKEILKIPSFLKPDLHKTVLLLKGFSI